MEPTDARRMVPCFDEPDFKAVWKIRVIHPKGTRAISNGLEIKNAVPTLVLIGHFLLLSRTLIKFLSTAGVQKI